MWEGSMQLKWHLRVSSRAVRPVPQFQTASLPPTGRTGLVLTDCDFILRLFISSRQRPKERKRDPGFSVIRGLGLDI
jgi:hypothetical protein